jgi:hypothetical protein
MGANNELHIWTSLNVAQCETNIGDVLIQINFEANAIHLANSFNRFHFLEKDVFFFANST